MSCPECLRALQRVVHQQYTEGCHGCTFRALAYMPSEQREHFYDMACHLSGDVARAELRRNVLIEIARIAALSAAMPRKEKA